MAARAHLIVFNQEEAFVDKTVELMVAHDLIKGAGLSLAKHDDIYHLLDQVLQIMEGAFHRRQADRFYTLCMLCSSRRQRLFDRSSSTNYLSIFLDRFCSNGG